MHRSIAVLFLVTLLACGRLAEAHPGHAVETSDSASVMHYLTHPDHLLWWAIIAAIVVTGIISGRNLRRKLAPAYARVRKHQP